MNFRAFFQRPRPPSRNFLNCTKKVEKENRLYLLEIETAGLGETQRGTKRPRIEDRDAQSTWMNSLRRPLNHRNYPRRQFFTPRSKKSNHLLSILSSSQQITNFPHIKYVAILPNDNRQTKPTTISRDNTCHTTTIIKVTRFSDDSYRCVLWKCWRQSAVHLSLSWVCSWPSW